MKKILNSLSKTMIVILSLVLILVVIRLFLPVGAKYGINWYLGNKIESYQGRIDDFDLSLYRGAYQIEDLTLWKKGSDQKSPLVAVDEIDLSLAWRALFQGKLLGDLHIEGLRVNIVDSESKKRKQTGAEEGNWNEVLSKLIPIEIESLRVTDGEVHFLNKDYRVPVDVFVDRIHIEAANLRNTNKKNILLPSHATIKGRLQSNAEFAVKAQFNILRNPLAFNMDGQMKEFTMSKLNPFFLVYGPFTFAKGKLSIFSEVAAKDGKLKGYVKPFLEDAKMVANKEKFISFKHGLSEFLLGASNILLKNPSEEAATKVKFEGPLNDPKVKTWDAVWASLRNSFGTPLKQSVEGSINIKDVPK